MASNPSAFTSAGAGSVTWANVTLAPYNADPSGVALTDTAFSLAVASGQPLYIPPGAYRTSLPLDWRRAGLQVYGAGKQNARIIQHADNTQIVRLAGAHQKITGIQFAYNTQQATGNANGICLSFGDDTIGSCFEGIYEDLYLINGNYGMAVDPSVVTVGGLFSCTVRSIRISQNGGTSGINIVASNGTGANITGNKWETIYVSNNFNGSPSSWGGQPVAFQGTDNDHISVLNIEHGNCFLADVLALTDCDATLVDDLHIESVPTSGTPGFGQILVNQSTAIIRSMQIRATTMTGATYNSVIRCGSASAGNRILVQGFSQPTGTVPASFAWVDFNSCTGSTATVQDVTSTLVNTNSLNVGAGDVLTVNP